MARCSWTMSQRPWWMPSTSSSAQDEKGIHYVGIAAGYVLTVTDGPVLYHSGDTAVFGDMKLIGELYHPRGGDASHWRALHDGTEGSCAGRELSGAKDNSPHSTSERFPPLKGNPEQLAALVDSSVEVVRWNPGETI